MLTDVEKEYEKYNPQLIVNMHHYIGFPNDDRKETIQDIFLSKKCIVGSVRRVLNMPDDYIMYDTRAKNKCNACTVIAIKLIHDVIWPVVPKQQVYEKLLIEFKRHIKEDHKMKF